jgi:hypothetical protein
MLLSYRSFLPNNESLVYQVLKAIDNECLNKIWLQRQFSVPILSLASEPSSIMTAVLYVLERCDG